MDPLKPTYTKTQRGFTLIEFKDMYGVACTLQDSSLATEPAIWLGVKDADPQILVPGKGWQKHPLPEGVLLNTRMHLTLEQANALIPLLQFFVDNQQLPKKSKDTHVEVHEPLRT